MKRLFKYAFVFCALILLSGAVHTGIAALIVSKADIGIEWAAKRKIFVTWLELKPQFCLFQVCLNAKNVQVSVSHPPFRFCPVDLTVRKGLFGAYKINVTAGDDSSDCLQVTGQASGTLDFWHIQELSFWQNGLGGVVNGTVDMLGQEIKLEGQTRGLADFVSLFIPKDFQFLATLVFSNGEQKISVRTDENYIRIFDVPILPKSVIFCIN